MPDAAFDIHSNAGGDWTFPGDPFALQESGVLGGRWSLTRTRNRLGRFDNSLNRHV